MLLSLTINNYSYQLNIHNDILKFKNQAQHIKISMEGKGWKNKEEDQKEKKNQQIKQFYNDPLQYI